jgi:soluble lytic murein transglycosylase-like protein
MRPSLRKAFPLAALGLVAGGVAVAQTYQALQPAPRIAPAAPMVASAPVQPMATVVRSAPMSDVSAFSAALAAARARDYDRGSTLQANIQDPVARKLVTWAIVDIAEKDLGFFRLDNARRDLWGWPREERRFGAAEQTLETAGLGPQKVIEWFGEQEPVTAPGAMALAAARQSLGQTDAAASMIRHWWRTKTFSGESQSRMLARFGGLIRPEDQAARSQLLAGQSTNWTERRVRMNDAIKVGNFSGAYGTVVGHDLPLGADYAEAEFFAGWLALRKLNNPAGAERHFARIAEAGKSPITRARAFYWQGRAAEARGDAAAAQAHYVEGSKYTTTFYGQLAAEKAGTPVLQLPAEVQPTAEDRARFEAREQVRALRILAAAGEKSLLNVFATHLDDSLEPGELALLVDTARGYGEPMLAMNIVRGAAQRGVVMAERGYPVQTPPRVMGGPEPAFVLGIIRQESGFQPDIRSSAGARGYMQLLPTTAELVARKLGVSYQPSMLTDPQYNMRLGSKYLGDQVDRFSGSYIMAAAAYNAGPGRPAQWINFCGDPRTGTTDPLDFIECIPFSETRNYVQRVLENTQIYRARLNGNSAPITLSADLKRGRWVPGQAAQAYTGPVGGTAPY